MRIKSWLARTLRKTIGTEQIINLLKVHSDEVLGRLEHHLTADPSPPAESGQPSTTQPDGSQLVELNGDALWVPADLLRYIEHTCVSAPDAPIKCYLAEQTHYFWIRERLHLGDNVLDVGANIGLFTCMMSRRIRCGCVGWVHAFEPSPRVNQDLRRLLQANGIEGVVVNTSAVSDRNGRATFYDVTADTVQREGSHLETLDRANAIGNPGHDLVEVETVTLDSYVAFHRMAPRLIKIDVEGAEFLVLEGGREFLRKSKPLLVIEYHPDSRGVFDHARLRTFLDECGYAYRHDDKTYYCE